MKRSIILILIIVSIIVVLAVFYFLPHNSALQTVQNIVGNNQLASGSYIKNEPGVPAHLSIPSIKVEADIQPAGLDKNGAMAVPPGPSGVTWYKFGPKPGEKGSSVLAGHYGPWLNGSKSVFDNLGKLAPGDLVYVKDENGRVFTFKVREKKIYKLNETAPEVFNKDDASHLNLITCSGQWLGNQKTFTNRLVVFTDLVK